jgi:hypothetical protein
VVFPSCLVVRTTGRGFAKVSGTMRNWCYSITVTLSIAVLRRMCAHNPTDARRKYSTPFPTTSIPWSKICEDGTLIQILCFWALSIVLLLSKAPPCFYLKTQRSETGFCLRLQVKPIQLVPIDRATPCFRTSAPRQDRVYKPSVAQTICES